MKQENVAREDNNDNLTDDLTQGMELTHSEHIQKMSILLDSNKFMEFVEKCTKDPDLGRHCRDQIDPHLGVKLILLFPVIMVSLGILFSDVIFSLVFDL